MAAGTGNLPNQGMDFTPFDILTAEEMDDLVENIESLADGSGIGDEAIGTSALAGEAVTSTKLAEAFFRGKHQAVTTNTQPTGLTVQFGWSYVVGSNTGTLIKAITFPEAFGSVPIAAFLTFHGAMATASGTPDSLDDFTTAFSDLEGSHTDDITTTGFNAYFHGSSNFSSSFNFGFSWMMIGTV